MKRLTKFELNVLVRAAAYAYQHGTFTAGERRSLKRAAHTLFTVSKKLPR